MAKVRDGARITLAIIRLLTGTTGLVAPAFLVRNLGVDPKTNPAILYVFRMFGIRTILVGLDLLRRDGPLRQQALREAPLIHASDVTAALIAALGGVPTRSGVTIVLISAVNTALAVIAKPRKRGSGVELG